MALNFGKAERAEPIRISLTIIPLLQQNVSDRDHRCINGQGNFASGFVIHAAKRRRMTYRVL
jgi:hypothetical protein